jgi:hypothetical protein
MLSSGNSRSQLPTDVLDLLREFSARDVRYLVVGAHALGYWGLPRATGDFDLLIEPTDDNARRVFAALQAFGAPLFDLTVADLATPGVVFQIGVPPYRIDLITRVSGVTFDEAWSERAVAELPGLSLPIIGRQALIRNKRASGRPKDLVDLQMLGED